VTVLWYRDVRVIQDYSGTLPHLAPPAPAPAARPGRKPRFASRFE
jgi:hypothetical protein